MAANRRGMILILSSPSGAGKTTLTRMLMQDQALDLTLSVSVTTRPRRSSEVDGIHYRFIDRREFERMRKAGDLLEWAEVHGNGYGTPREPVEKVLAQGRDMLFDVDWQGARQVRERLGDSVVSIFVLPPSMRELRSRLERRAEDSIASIDTRLEAARQEIGRWRNYQYVIVNDDLQRAYRDVVAIVTAERLRVDTGRGGDRGFRREAYGRLSEGGEIIPKIATIPRHHTGSSEEHRVSHAAPRGVDVLRGSAADEHGIRPQRQSIVPALPHGAAGRRRDGSRRSAEQSKRGKRPDNIVATVVYRR